MKRIVFFLAAVLVCRSSQAEILLAEFEFTQPEPITLPADYTFTVRNESLPPLPDTRPQMARWSDTIEAVPVTQVADSELVTQFNAITTNSPNNVRSVFFFQGGQAPIGNAPTAERNFNTIWDAVDRIPDDGFRAQAFVPYPLGTYEPHHQTGLWGYIVTGLERTITAESQLVRIYGHPIPEPTAWILLLAGGLHVNRRFRGLAERLGGLPRR